ncbi:hypothetical protein KOXY103107_06420 [Komagataeibacter xylinus]
MVLHHLHDTIAAGQPHGLPVGRHAAIGLHLSAQGMQHAALARMKQLMQRRVHARAHDLGQAQRGKAQKARAQRVIAQHGLDRIAQRATLADGKPRHVNHDRARQVAQPQLAHQVGQGIAVGGKLRGLLGAAVHAGGRASIHVDRNKSRGGRNAGRHAAGQGHGGLLERIGLGAQVAVKGGTGA